MDTCGVRLYSERPGGRRYDDAGIMVVAPSQSRGLRSTSTSCASREPGAGWASYSQRAVSGIEHMIDSIRAPGVCRPNLVPRSCTRLNST